MAEKIRRTVPQKAEVLIWWLGQSGFILRSHRSCIVVDPYLSTTLEDATRDQSWKRHVRMMPICVQPGDLTGVDAIFCTHAHRDHYDPPTIRALQLSNPSAILTAPAACAEIMHADGLHNVLAADTEKPLAFNGFSVGAIPSMHNCFDYSEQTGYPYLGYIFDFDGVRIYHAGDTLLYDGLADRLRKWNVHLALLPINGRTPELIAKGFQSNLNYREAPQLCADAGIAHMIPCHYDMFTINTEQVGKFVNYTNANIPDLCYWVPVIGEPFHFNLSNFYIYPDCEE